MQTIEQIRRNLLELNCVTKDEHINDFAFKSLMCLVIPKVSNLHLMQALNIVSHEHFNIPIERDGDNNFLRITKELLKLYEDSLRKRTQMYYRYLHLQPDEFSWSPSRILSNEMSKAYNMFQRLELYDPYLLSLQQLSIVEKNYQFVMDKLAS